MDIGKKRHSNKRWKYRISGDPRTTMRITHTWLQPQPEGIA